MREGADVTTSLYGAGYGSPSRLYEEANAQFGMTPATYRSGGAGKRVSFTTTASPLGLLLVAATERGLCSVRFGSSSTELENEMRDEFHAAEIVRDDVRLRNFVALILAAVDDGKSAIDLPLDIKATAFQRRVWDALRRIPAGQTRSYADVAAQIGEPTAVRAVARACAGNPVAVVIPCHRVVRKNGELAGYRWGAERKQKLLGREQDCASPARKH